MHDLQIVFVIEFVARQNAELVARPKSVTGTIRVRESWKAWFCARERSVSI
ncbi:hypothetical protein FY136_26400 (plasmid) [Agrobacterium tumefaciens]|uniref:hypothetical protein n=1 Tax=Agrobacterium tumefaciens TaxID=358 RepID=UPI0021CE1624|nr:hypothetical protein [Agrobacterium tumefaciens]UXT52792.1 hypothetical protein FY136_26400 [Agrobacterium tumefaciens]